MAQLAFNLNDGNEFVFDIDDEVLSLGRSSDNAIVIDNTYISAHHAEFRKVQGSQDYEIIDLGSANGIDINGSKVEKAVLKDGDKLTLGQLACRYYRDKAPQRSSPQPREAAAEAPVRPRPQPPAIKKITPPRQGGKPDP